jgi:TolB-like protein/tetratricopeptide (TPR) repeat protein
MDREEVSFGRFRVDLSQRQLVLDGMPVRLGRRALDILCVLAAAKGELVSKDELMTRVWPGLIVAENNVQVHVSALRKALDEEKSGQSYLVTVPGRGYRLIGLKSSVPATVGNLDSRLGSVLPDKPSIAVLPFQSMSADPEQEYFADGVVEEIITALSRFSGLFVIARNSSFTYKGRAVDVKQVGRELGVRYVLEGSVRRADKRVRITGQLVDAATGTHLWAHRFDGEIEDLFEVQDQVTASVVGAIAPPLEQAEIERVKQKSTESLEAYDYYLRGKASFHHWKRETNDEAVRLFYRAIDIDPDFAAPNGMAALCYAQRKMNGWMADPQQEVTECARLVERAVELGRDDAVALSSAGLACLRVVGDISTAAALVDQALALNPNLAQALYASSFVKNCQGDSEGALQRLKHVMRLSPIDPLMYMMHTGSALAHFLAGRYDEASAWAERALRDKPNYYPALRMAAASNALGGRLDQAKNAIARLRRFDPALRIFHLKDILPLRRAEHFAKYAKGLRMAGLPE